MRGGGRRGEGSFLRIENRRKIKIVKKKRKIRKKLREEVKL